MNAVSKTVAMKRIVTAVPSSLSALVIAVPFVASLLLVTAATAWLWCAVPGNYEDVLLASSHDRLALLASRENFLSVYAHWLSHLPTQGLGISQHWEVSVSSLIATAASRTLLLAALTTIVVGAFALLVGHFAFDRPGRQHLSIVLGLLTAIPTHLTVLISLVALGYFRGGSQSELVNFLAAAAVWSLSGVGYVTHLWITSIDRFSALPCHATAKAHGCSRARIYWKHATAYARRDSLETLKQFFLLCCVGSVIVETGLGLKGLGRLAWDSWQYRDFPVLMGLSVSFFSLHWMLDRRPTWLAR